MPPLSCSQCTLQWAQKRKKFSVPFNWYSWTALTRIRLFQLPLYFELKTYSLPFALQSFPIGYLKILKTESLNNAIREFSLAIIGWDFEIALFSCISKLRHCLIVFNIHQTLFLTIFICPDDHSIRQRPITFYSKSIDLNPVRSKLEKTLKESRAVSWSRRVTARTDVTVSLGIQVRVVYAVSQ